ncbi:MAG: hypothetical protein CMJ18_06115 [Phycisphaeraceae bacterium]|nr:hypothetical protein [Phycisphaeraceae bacterium]
MKTLRGARLYLYRTGVADEIVEVAGLQRTRPGFGVGQFDGLTHFLKAGDFSDAGNLQSAQECCSPRE